MAKPLRPAAEVAAEVLAAKVVGGNSGHGHVWPRPDGVRARCGGPPLCSACATDAAGATAEKANKATAIIEADRAELLEAAVEALRPEYPDAVAALQRRFALAQPKEKADE